MPLMPMMQMRHKVEQQLKVMADGEAIEALTYKKDRGFVLLKKTDNIFTLAEFGYVNACVTNDSQQIKKQLKAVIKREFPRSNQAWVQFFQHVDDPFQLHGKQPQINLF